MKTVIWSVVFLLSLFFSILAIKGSTPALLIGVPILWFSIKSTVKNKHDFSFVPNVATIWVTALAIVNSFAPLPIHQFLLIVFTLVSSVFISYATFYAQRKFFHSSTKLKTEVKQNPLSIADKMNELDKMVSDKKRKVSVYGWIGLFIEEPTPKEEENAMYFNLGREVELDKRRTTEKG
ncbi:hypothetical protein AWH56_008740 [Anaerobacillus isosaccharinicus]|uniref:Uncharacterized protein n=1 Tax=Anaerobacillus isosaccharinicus TaxID=1532552 RepID=A0A1S2L1A5_9BACI|nr:hypothetical protein [Anaerobacillus isosaccharinicus]MBA5588940.1 hypothetical protein [Anaerobacillus isosaccharinicus]QOY37651.1 hypothetical protein AWH56_008740 [Anaerobacillus isosaccharinicus]